MRSITPLLITIGLLLATDFCNAQSFNSGKNRKTFKGIKSKFPHQGLGFKLGDPFAATYKLYLTENFGAVLDVGSPASGLYNNYFRDQFPKYAASDTFSTSTASLRYLSHKIKSNIVGEIKFLYHFDANELSPGVQLYFGAGWEWKQTRLQYTYLYNAESIENSPGTFSRKRLTMGPQFIGGLEYGGFKFPVSAFIEIEYFRDIQIDPGYYRFEGGVGLRYLF
jgi:hypothetical protein